jgi:hypothetical protein
VSKGPGSINFVSIILYGALAAGLYCAWQFGIPYYQGWRVDGALSDARREAGRFIPGVNDPREESVLGLLRKEVIDLGADEDTLQLYFAQDGKSLHAEYTIVINHPFGDPTVWNFHHQEPIVPVGR